jgi:hypothetical protein
MLWDTVEMIALLAVMDRIDRHNNGTWTVEDWHDEVKANQNQTRVADEIGPMGHYESKISERMKKQLTRFEGGGAHFRTDENGEPIYITRDWELLDQLIGDVKAKKGTKAILVTLIGKATALMAFCPYGVPLNGRRLEAEKLGFKGWAASCSNCNTLIESCTCDISARCRMCGRELTNPESIKKGIGPECESNQRMLDAMVKLMTTEHGEETIGCECG